jgi:hypothetical protein
MRLTFASTILVAVVATIVTAPAPRALGRQEGTPSGRSGRPGVSAVPCPEQAWQPGDPAFAALPGAEAVSGSYDGGLYRIEIPERWNGDLVLFAHGYVPAAGPNGSTLRPSFPPIREHLIRSGFAWATSSYRCNGYVPGQGLLDTMALTELFTKANAGATPRRTYLTGQSMGGHVTILGLHEFPTTFAGGLAMCPAGPELFDYFAAVSAAAEVVTGVELDRDGLVNDLVAIGRIVGTPPDYTPQGLQLASIQIQLSGGPRPFAVQGLEPRFLANVTTSAGALAGNTTPLSRAIGTTHIKYAIGPGLGLTSEAVDSRVRRKTPDAAVRSAGGPYDELVPFDGAIERPLMSIHGTGDLFVPIHLQQILKRAVVAAGKQDLLAQRIMRIPGHCQFSEAETTKAFDDLVAWVERGVKPEGDDVLGDLSNAGLTFTSPLRPGDPGELTVAPRP